MNTNMNMNARAGSGGISVFLSILFIASIALNAAFLTGCISMTDIFGNSSGVQPNSEQGPTPIVSESVYLREIAALLGLSPSSDKTPGDIAFDIGQVLNSIQRYKGGVLSDQSFDECKAAIPTSKDTEIFEAYHAFIKKIKGKRIIVVGDDGQR